MIRNIKFTCRTCGSDQVTFDAVARWDVEAQTYVVSTLYDDCFCESDTCLGNERRVQERDAVTGEELGLGPGTFDYIPKAEAEAAWQAYNQRREAERQKAEAARQQEQIIAENTSTLSAAVEEMPA